ncbi:MAG: N-acetylmuramoyl-L-alanine amidase [Verrucomicrobiota bacterium]
MRVCRSLLFLSIPAMLLLMVGVLAQTPSGKSNRITPVMYHWDDLKINTSLMIPEGKFARKRVRDLKPKYITVHSTANRARGAGARTHGRAQLAGNLKSTHNSLGYLSWHFSIDDKDIYQSLPCNEQGQHADYEGEGNTSSIGIEMCENVDNSQAKTLDRTARFVALLMKNYNIPLKKVVPHYHWNRVRFDDGKVLGHKACPGILMDQGKPGPKWEAFVRKIGTYHTAL